MELKANPAGLVEDYAVSLRNPFNGIERSFSQESLLATISL